MMVISIFGGASPKPGSLAYQLAEELGRRLGEAGFGVATGGYIGTMEAVSKGASGAGVRVIGVTCSEIESWRDVRANRWVTEEVRCGTLTERLQRLIEIGDALVALPGGIGTLSEISVAWSLLQVEAIPARPLILVGDLWRRTFHVFLENADGYVHQRDAARLTFLSGVDDVVATLVSEYEGRPLKSEDVYEQ